MSMRPLIIAMHGFGPPLLIVARGFGKALFALLVIAGAAIMGWIFSYLLFALYVVWLLVSGPL